MVVVSHEREFIFLKTRKTTGTSIEMLLESKIVPPGRQVTEATPTFIWDGGVVAARLSGPQPNSWREHLPAKKVREFLGDDLWRRYFRFSSVRNPFDRAVSFFFWLRQFRQLPALTNFDDARRAFHDFIDSSDHKPDRGIVFVDGDYVPHDMIRFEHMADDIGRIGRRLGLDLCAEDMPKTKDKTPKIPGRHVSEYFDEKSRRLVTHKLAWVFDRFDYSTNPADVVGKHEHSSPASSLLLNSRGEQ